MNNATAATIRWPLPFQGVQQVMKRGTLHYMGNRLGKIGTRAA